MMSYPSLEPASLMVLQDYFITFIDRGVNADETPLFTRSYQGEPLDEVVSRRLGVSLDHAGEIIDAAGQFISI